MSGDIFVEGPQDLSSSWDVHPVLVTRDPSTIWLRCRQHQDESAGRNPSNPATHRGADLPSSLEGFYFYPISAYGHQPSGLRCPLVGSPEAPEEGPDRPSEDQYQDQKGGGV